MKRKKMGLLVIIILACSAVMTAQESALIRGHYMPGNFQVGVDAGARLNYFDGLGLVLYPEAELMLAKVRPGGVFSIDIGGMGFARIGLNAGGVDPGVEIGAGGMAGFHLGLNGLSVPGMEAFAPLDIVAAFGAGFDISNARLAFAAESGLQYFITPNIAIRLMYRHFGSNSDATIGIAFKTGKGETGDTVDVGAGLREIEDGIRILEGNSAFMQFQAFYMMSLGYYPYGWGTLDEYESTRWKIETDDGELMTVSRGLLTRTGDGSWNQLIWETEGDRVLYEFFVDTRGDVTELRYRYPEGEQMVYYPRRNESYLEFEEDSRTLEDSEYEFVGTESVRVEAGQYEARHYRYADDDGEHNYWISEEVPGGMVKYSFSHGEDLLQGELQAVGFPVTPQLGEY
ncbi:outer membrane protein [Salinispira pacifica]|uniref:Uncharacterized protein n=1 Tax=Salinispira pacifica TaxID=1307761 RepID=V5WH22_9SPIO|nr:hypothetical protein [Salinispira pacifica]AHC14930.1 hypothetical protein L21SP2_1537 [Salinispira pacifica]